MKKVTGLKRESLILICAGAVCALIFLISCIVILKTPKVSLSYEGESLNEMYRPEQRDFLTPDAKLPKGIYDVRIDFETQNEAITQILYKATSKNTLLSDNPMLEPFEKSKQFTIWVNDTAADFHVNIIENGEGDPTLHINSVYVTTAKISKFHHVLCTFLFFLLIFGIVLFIVKLEDLSKYSLPIIGIAVITLISSLGLFTRYVPYGHDLNFHLLRIEGLKDAILMGDLPAKVQTNWCYGYGYAVSAMYGDLTIYLPALMRVCGFTLGTSYKTFVFIMNLLTAVSAYLCFGKICKNDRYFALLISFMYTASPYRMCCIYIRAAFGEYSGMLFLPMIALGLYYLFAEDIDSEDYGKKLLLPILGFTGLLQTHILSCLMILIFMVIFFLVFFTLTFRRETFIALLKIAGATIAINLGFLVPLFTFLKEPLNIHYMSGYNQDFQIYGLTLTEILAQRSSESIRFNWAFFTNLGERMSMPVGNGFIILLVIFFYQLWNKKASDKKESIKGQVSIALIGLLSLFMASTYFPYDWMEKYLGGINSIITRVNIPYRYVTTAVFFFSLFAALAYPIFKKKHFVLITLVVLLVSADQSLDGIYGVLYNGIINSYYDGINLDTNDLVGYEYLYAGTDYHRINGELDVVPFNTDIIEYNRNKNRFDLSIGSTADDAYIELPLYYYPGYAANNASGKKLFLARGYNNRLRIKLDPGYTGTVKLRYVEPVLWRIAEIVSLLALIALVIYYIKIRRGKRWKKESICWTE